ncbi:unnamed protein product [Parascedosporium putredinis]|uniref:tRNA (adenine(58)-N(1))-methyltransferase catalytic subunit TRM61 n=1 Tax=Parascedosporium putredinis TaxID=1442378 RepID=A0A9P1M6P6_9PEZI|nr:unnamed protein product [Parascedosporium putredinis]CAI7987567.1 unnamed protein product [Parascedosporium putredinis]
MAAPSPFLHSTSRSQANSLAIVHLSRDNLVPIILQDPATATDGYAEGAVLNSRFGSFPHSTLIDVPWGSQIRASTVDTGSRGRRKKAALAAEADDKNGAALDHQLVSDLKRKREGAEDSSSEAEAKRQRQSDAVSAGNGHGPNGAGSPAPAVQPAIAASSGFVHILKPSPELWTISLPHRTQVVYTPDYSYVLQRIRAFPGKTLIEAGAGSGSFSHAAARAVFNGFSSGPEDKKGKVYSFEYHQQRYQKMQLELAEHGLEGVVQITHRDVYTQGFNIDGKSPKANAIFLDLPAPWEALHHLSRRRPQLNGSHTTKEGSEEADTWLSPLDPDQSVYICTFSPCVEQVTKTIEKLRELGWVGIEMVEVAQKKMHVTRERIGLNVPMERGTLQAPSDISEAISRLKAINARAAEYHAKSGRAPGEGDDRVENGEGPRLSETDGLEGSAASSKPWNEGRLVHRPEVELKTHTSYLTFAVLPREWSEEEEAAALARWPCGQETEIIGALDKATRKNLKREQVHGKKKQKKGKA